MITQVSWKLFQEIESKGGIGQYKNVLMDAVEANLKLQQSLISSGERVVVGINKYQPKTEKPARIAGHTLTGFLEKE
jgi:methylmalonyl-CoA mutase N-terminal domain/subunit